MRRWRLGLAALLAVLPPAAAAEAAEGGEGDDDDVREELPAGFPGFLDRYGLSLEADLEFTHERLGGERATELTFDEVDLGWSRHWVELSLGIVYTTDGGVTVEDAVVRIGGGDGTPWFAEGGRLVLPFGEAETAFVEDPLAVTVGEVDDEALVAGFLSERLAFAVAGFSGTHAEGRDPDFVMALSYSDPERWAIGGSWLSDVGESVEFRELRDELDLVDVEEGVVGGSAFARYTTGAWELRSAWTGALESFPARTLDPLSARTPTTWHVEVTRALGERVRAAARWERSHDVPAVTDRRGGIGVAVDVTEHVSAKAEVLRGRSGDEDVTQLGALLGFEY